MRVGCWPRRKGSECNDTCIMSQIMDDTRRNSRIHASCSRWHETHGMQTQMKHVVQGLGRQEEQQIVTDGSLARIGIVGRTNER
jgi:hypothetical protein